MKYFAHALLVIGGVMFSMCVLIAPVKAQNSTEVKKVVPIYCDRGKGVYKQTSKMILIPLDDTMYRLPGESAESIAKKLYYEFAYIRGNNASPLNAVLIGGRLEYLACEYPDYAANVITNEDEGVFVLGVYGEVAKETLQSVVDAYSISTIEVGSFTSTTENKNTTISLSDKAACGTYCLGITMQKGGLSSRKYTIEYDKPSYSTSVRQQEQVSFSVKVKNTSAFPLYETGTAGIKIVPLKGKSSQLYHSSWVSPDVVATISSYLLPETETVVTATLGAPLLPGKYEESLQFKIGNTLIGEPFKISFTVEKDNLKLGKIVPKNGEPYANLRETPSLSGGVIGRLDVGTYVIIRKYDGAWVQIETKEGRKGWVYKPFIREI